MVEKASCEGEVTCLVPSRRVAATYDFDGERRALSRQIKLFFCYLKNSFYVF